MAKQLDLDLDAPAAVARVEDSVVPAYVVARFMAASSGLGGDFWDTWKDARKDASMGLN